MSLFGSSPPGDSPSQDNSAMGRSSTSLFDEDGPMTKSTTTALFNDDDDFEGSGRNSPWDMPTPRKQTRADVIRNLLTGTDVPDSYIETFDNAVRQDGSSGKVNSAGVTKTLAAAKIGADDQAKIMSIVAPGGEDAILGRNEFNVLLALIGLSQEGDTVSLDGVDERRRNLPQPKLSNAANTNKPQPAFPDFAELGAKPPQRPETPPRPEPPQKSSPQRARARKPSMDSPEDDPWNTPDLHKDHDHGDVPSRTNGNRSSSPNIPKPSNYATAAGPGLTERTTSTFTTTSIGGASAESEVQRGGGWGSGYFSDDTAPTPGDAGGFGNPPQQPASPFGASGEPSSTVHEPSFNPVVHPGRTISGGRTGSAIEENLVVTLMPEKEGMFLFQHHNYEVASARRGSKVVRRYSDFVWLLDCLHKRYPFRVLPLLPPKRVAVNGNHLSNDTAFIEKRRRGLARFLNAVIRHPVLGAEQLVVMFLTVPTELSVWRKQAAISVVDEFTNRPLPPGLEDSLPPSLNDLFDRTRQGVRRSADLYIHVCSVMDRLVKRTEGVAADHARMALSLATLTETSNDTYATDTNDVPLLNDGLIATSKHLRLCQSVMEDESKAWDQGVLEDLKRQRDSLVSLKDMFDRRERLDKDTIPYLERRIQSNETRLAALRAKPDGLVKPGEVEKVAESIIKDKESIVNQHNRSIFVKECVRDELIYFQSTQYHVSRWNQDWAQERVKYSEMLADNWRRLLDELDGMPLGD